MKHFCYFLAALILCISFCNVFNNKICFAATESYAQILSDNVYMYKEPTNNGNLSNLLFVIPQTYFVQILALAENNFYQAKYIDEIGYVRHNEVQCVRGIPKQKYFEIGSFRVYGESSMAIRKSPIRDTSQQNIIENLPQYSTNFIFYGKVAGEEFTLGRTNVWYYCKYIKSNVKGYIYSDNTDSLTNIIVNTETLPYIDKPSFLDTGEKLIDQNAQNAVIIILSIPMLIFVFMLIKGSALFSASQTQKEKRNDKEIGEF